AGQGGEEQANLPPAEQEGALGPGRLVDRLLEGDGAIVSTLVCGDTFFNEHPDEAREAVRAWLEAVRPDAVLAGPAFAAGRYGSACAHVALVADNLAVPCVSGMHPENPGRLVHPTAYVVAAQRTPAGLADVLRSMGGLAR